MTEVEVTVRYEILPYLESSLHQLILAIVRLNSQFWTLRKAEGTQDIQWSIGPFILEFEVKGAPS